MESTVFNPARVGMGVGPALRTGVSVLALCMLAAAPAYGQTTQTTPKPGKTQGGSTSETSEEELEPTAGQVQGSDEAEAPETAISQSTEPEEPSGEAAGDDIVVTGIRQSLANAQNIKRNADTVVDAITSQDIGALPDRSVTEALQRVPGVSINRFAGANDPDHFSVEGSGVVVRGLTFVRSEFNGRDTFSTGVYGQAINFADVPAELLGSVEVYKNSTAEMIEGGLAGTVNMNLRTPFDNKGFHIGFDVQANFSDLIKKFSPIGSLLVSNTWETGIGRLGLLGATSYSQVINRSDGIQVTNFQLRNGTYSNVNAPGAGTGICRAPLPGNTDTTGFPPVIPGGQNEPCYGPAPAGADGFADFLPLAYAPVGGQFRTQDYNRERRGIAAAAQWESLDRRALVTAQFLRTHSTQKWGEHTFESGPDLAEYNTFPIGCLQNGNNPGGRPRAQCPTGGTFPFQNYEYGEDNVFESGYITLPGTGWRSANSGCDPNDPADDNNPPNDNPCLGIDPWRTPTGGIQQSLSRREVDDTNIVQDHGLNVKFAPNDRWAFNFDGQYVKAKHDNLDVSVFGSTFADQELDLSGDVPVLIPHKPLNLSATWSGCTPAPGMPAGTCSPNARINNATSDEYFQDPYNYFWRAAMDHYEQSRGKEWAFRGDVSYNFLEDVPFLRRAKFGARYSDRDQKVRYTTYNWGALSEVWSGTPGSQAVYMDMPISQPHVEFFDFPNFFRGNTSGPVGGWYFNGDLIGDYDDAQGLFRQIANQWTASGGAAGTWVPLNQRAGAVAGTPFIPSDIQNVGERNRAAYAMLSFGQDEPIFGNVTVDGNIGIRYVDTRVESEGSIGVPTQQALGVTQPFNVRCALVPPPPGSPPGTPPSQPGGVCNLGPAGYAALQQFATGQTVEDIARHKYDFWLPSLNVKFGLTEDLILRLAASRNLARPSMADIRNFLTIGGVNTGAGTLNLQATAGNPFLKPALSDNFDASLEWYFARVGSLTFNAYLKNVHNMFFQDITTRDVTSNGVTQTVNIRGPANFEGTGKIRGFEVAYQQTFDFLPGMLSGLGLAANYSYIKSKGLPRLGVFTSEQSPVGVQGNLPFENISKHNVNVAGWYEKGPLSLRAAYNWRSRFLITSADVIFPYFPIYNEATGTLDASAFYSITKNVKVGVQGSNLTDETLQTLQQFSPEGLIGPRSYFMNDRRYSFVVRGSF